MFRLPLPFHRWPLWQHGVVTSLILAVLGVASWSALRGLQLSHKAVAADLAGEQRLFQAMRDRQTTQAGGDFSKQLPPAAAADEVSRDIARFAESNRVQIQSLALQAHAPTTRELGRIQYTVSAVADYPALKAWLAELLSRYPSLGLSALTLRAAPNEPTRLGSSVSLLLYVKD